MMERTEKIFFVWMGFCALAGIAWVIFVIWVIIKVMQYIGVI